MMARRFVFAIGVALLDPSPAQAFDYFEHKYLGDQACAVVAEIGRKTGRFSVSCAVRASLGVTFGDIVALSGDHYESDPEDCCDLIRDLDGEHSKLRPVQQLVRREVAEADRWAYASGLSRDELSVVDLAAVSDAVISDDFSRLHDDVFPLPRVVQVNPGDRSDVDVDTRAEAVMKQLHERRARGSGCFKATPLLQEAFNALPGYVGLAGDNASHFGASALRRYRALHAKAVERRIADPAAALIIEALAQHFLTDVFAAGHVRTVRRRLAPSEGKTRHDWDNETGLIVRGYIPQGSAGMQPHAWLAFGDGCLWIKSNDGNRRIAIAMAARSLLEIIAPDAVPSALLIYRPTAIPLLSANPAPPLSAASHVVVGSELSFTWSGGTLQPAMGFTVSANTPIRPLALETRVIIAAEELRIAPLWAAEEWIHGVLGSRVVPLEPQLRFGTGANAKGVVLESRVELVWLLYPPVQVRATFGTTVHVATFAGASRNGTLESWGAFGAAFRLPGL